MKVLFNDTVISDDNARLILNRGLKFGDALFETIRVMHGKALYVAEHYHRLMESVQLLQMTWSAGKDLKWFESILNQYIQENSLSQARMRFMVYRAGAGLYTPVENNVNWLLEAAEVPWPDYAFNEQGQTFCLFKELYKPSYYLSRIKTTNVLVFVMAGLYMKQEATDNCFVLNEKGFVVEAMSSNIFVVKKNVGIITLIWE